MGNSGGGGGNSGDGVGGYSRGGGGSLDARGLYGLNDLQRRGLLGE